MWDTDVDKDDVDVTDRDQVDTALRDTDDNSTVDVNERPGLLDGAVIPPVAYVGPNAGTPNLGVGSSTGTGAGVVPFPVPAVPVVEDGRVEEGVLVNPFTPADPDNEAPFDANYPSSDDLPSRVEAELAADGRLSGCSIAVLRGDNGTITLTGTAPSAELAGDAADIAAHIPGVRGVVNEIRATGI